MIRNQNQPRQPPQPPHTEFEFHDALPSFIAKLYAVIEDPKNQHIIGYYKNSRSSIIFHDVEVIREKIVREYFSPMSYTQFAKQLSHYHYYIQPCKWEGKPVYILGRNKPLVLYGQNTSNQVISTYQLHKDVGSRNLEMRLVSENHDKRDLSELYNTVLNRSLGWMEGDSSVPYPLREFLSVNLLNSQTHSKQNKSGEREVTQLSQQNAREGRGAGLAQNNNQRQKENEKLENNRVQGEAVGANRLNRPPNSLNGSHHSDVSNISVHTLFVPGLDDHTANQPEASLLDISSEYNRRGENVEDQFGLNPLGRHLFLDFDRNRSAIVNNDQIIEEAPSYPRFDEEGYINLAIHQFVEPPTQNFRVEKRSGPVDTEIEKKGQAEQQRPKKEGRGRKKAEPKPRRPKRPIKLPDIKQPEVNPSEPSESVPQQAQQHAPSVEVDPHVLEMKTEKSTHLSAEPFENFGEQMTFEQTIQMICRLIKSTPFIVQKLRESYPHEIAYLVGCYGFIRACFKKQVIRRAMTEREKEVLHKNVNRLMYGAKVLEHEIGLPARDQEPGRDLPDIEIGGASRTIQAGRDPRPNPSGQSAHQTATNGRSVERHSKN